MHDSRNRMAVTYMRQIIVLFEERAAELHGYKLKLSTKLHRRIETLEVNPKNHHLTRYWFSKGKPYVETSG